MINVFKIKEAIKNKNFVNSFGEIKTFTEQVVISKGPICKIGDLCLVGEQKVPCEVVSIRAPFVSLMPLYGLKNLKLHDRVYVVENQMEIPRVEHLLGRTINGLGEFVDGLNPLPMVKRAPIKLNREAPEALSRKRISNVLETGIKAIDSLLTIGEGQRMGIFAGTGVGKSTLLGMIARKAKADVNVIALIGERGREVREFLEDDLGEEGLAKSVVIVSTSDQQPLMKIKASQLAMSIAEEFRDQGKTVLFMMDSVMRFAEARKEIDMATGEVENGGKTPTMLPYLKELLERAGTSDRGTITGIYTVLAEGDDMQAPIPDMVRGIIDGHIVLDRTLTQKRHYPAIDILQSTSRVMDDIAEDEHKEMARDIANCLSVYKENEVFFNIDAYVPGENEEVDRAKELYPKIIKFLQQGEKESFEFEETYRQMKEAIER